MTTKLRGSGYKYTLPWVLPTFALWVVVLVVTAPVLAITMMVSDLIPYYLHEDVWFFLYTRTPAIALAGIGLAVFSSTRTAGPLIQLGRAFDDVKNGDMDRRVVFRRGDKAFRGLEVSFNEMMDVLNERLESGVGAEAEDRGAPQRSHDENQRDLALSAEPSLTGEG